MKNALAYYTDDKITAIKLFMVQAKTFFLSVFTQIKNTGLYYKDFYKSNLTFDSVS